MTRALRYLFLTLLLAGLTGCATSGSTGGGVTSRQVTDEGTWLTLSNGCKLLDSSTKVPDDTKISWSGPCRDGLADGKGTLNTSWNNESNWARSDDAGFVQGRRDGVWTTQNSGGSKQVRSYRNGKLHGLSAQLNANGTYQEYFFVNNKRIISWLVAYSYPDGRWCTGTCSEQGPSKNYVIVMRAEGKEDKTQPCGTDVLQCRKTVRAVVKETMRLVMEKAKGTSAQPVAR